MQARCTHEKGEASWPWLNITPNVPQLKAWRRNMYKKRREENPSWESDSFSQNMLLWTIRIRRQEVTVLAGVVNSPNGMLWRVWKWMHWGPSCHGGKMRSKQAAEVATRWAERKKKRGRRVGVWDEGMVEELKANVVIAGGGVGPIWTSYSYKMTRHLSALRATLQSTWRSHPTVAQNQAPFCFHFN